MSEVPDVLRTALADRYALERVVGRGGMATVYLAADMKHRRHVAVKVLRPDLAASIGTDRFLKEIEIAAGLAHPHIVPLHDSGEARDFLYYVMPYIEGESLRARLNRERRLSVSTAIRIAGDVADALNYAHGVGVLHRDIKPENILFAHGHAVVADFGVAKAITTAADPSFTRTGLALGTPGYMSPEQAAGVRDVDVRTDVYGLGCVLYEMLVGETPGLWLTDEAVRLERFLDASNEHRAILDTLSGSLEQVLVKALAMHPDKRYATATAFATALKAAPSRTATYREGEVTDIIKRASELELERPAPPDALSVGGVEQVAAQVGIPPARVREAVHDLDRPARPSVPQRATGWNSFLGRSHRLTIDRIVPGEVPENAFAFLADEIRMTMGTVGLVGTLGRSMTWSTSPPGQGAGRNVQITIAARNGETRIHIEEHFANLAGGLFGGIMGGGGGGLVAMSLAVSIESLHMPVVGVLAAVASVAGSYAIARGFYTTTFSRRERELNALADNVADQVARAVPWSRLDEPGPSKQLPR
jgi:serine/threonine protein kinase